MEGSNAAHRLSLPCFSRSHTHIPPTSLRHQPSFFPPLSLTITTTASVMQLPDLAALGPAGAGAAATLRERMVVQEAAVAAAVAHAHVVAVYSVGLRPCRPPRAGAPAVADAGAGGGGALAGAAAARGLTPDMVPALMAQPAAGGAGASSAASSAPALLWQLTS